jgi:hypothetical protein
VAAAAGVGAVVVPSGNYLVDGLALPSGMVPPGVSGRSYYGAAPAVLWGCPGSVETFVMRILLWPVLSFAL